MKWFSPRSRPTVRRSARKPGLLRLEWLEDRTVFSSGGSVNHLLPVAAPQTALVQSSPHVGAFSGVPVSQAAVATAATAAAPIRRWPR